MVQHLMPCLAVVTCHHEQYRDDVIDGITGAIGMNDADDAAMNVMSLSLEINTDALFIVMHALGAVGATGPRHHKLLETYSVVHGNLNAEDEIPCRPLLSLLTKHQPIDRGRHLLSTKRVLEALSDHPTHHKENDSNIQIHMNA